MDRRTFALDRAIIKATGFSLGCFQIALHRGERYYPSLVLTTVGRKSAQLREAALPYVERDGELVVVASLGGGPAEPHWAQNLRADPRCWLTLHRHAHAATARELVDTERREALAQVADDPRLRDRVRRAGCHQWPRHGPVRPAPAMIEQRERTTTRTLVNGGIRLVYDHAPGERTPVVLLHGGGQNRHSWGALFRRLERSGHEVASLDHRGHGDSDWTVGGYRLVDYASDVEALLGTIGRPSVIVGASLGGLAGLHAAAKRPDLVAGLVIVDITTRPQNTGTTGSSPSCRRTPMGSRTSTMPWSQSASTCRTASGRPIARV